MIRVYFVMLRLLNVRTPQIAGKFCWQYGEYGKLSQCT